MRASQVYARALGTVQSNAIAVLEELSLTGVEFFRHSHFVILVMLITLLIIHLLDIVPLVMYLRSGF